MQYDRSIDGVTRMCNSISKIKKNGIKAFHKM